MTQSWSPANESVCSFIRLQSGIVNKAKGVNHERRNPGATPSARRRRSLAASRLNPAAGGGRDADGHGGGRSGRDQGGLRRRVGCQGHGLPADARRTGCQSTRSAPRIRRLRGLGCAAAAPRRNPADELFDRLLARLAAHSAPRGPGRAGRLAEDGHADQHRRPAWRAPC